MLGTMTAHCYAAPGRMSRRPASQRGRTAAPIVRRPYPVFIAYSDVPAARHAIARLAKAIRHGPNERELLPMLWRFDQLDQPRWRRMALREAARAVTIVLTMSTRASLSNGTEAWLTALTAQQRGATISALLLVGDESWTISLQQTVKQSSQPTEALLRAEETLMPRASHHEQIVAACAA